MCESVFNKEYELSELVDFVSDKIDAKKVSLNTYISTDNMLVDRGGVEPASKLPSASKFNHFQEGDTLFSNIRTYFRKVWLADFDGGASPDVLIFRTKDSEILDPTYLYYLLSNEEFVEYTVLTAKGAKMPRGDKAAIMQFKTYLPDITVQRKMASILLAFDKKRHSNIQTNQTLEQIAQAIFKSWFVDFEPVRAKIAVLEAGGTAEQAELAAMSSISGKTEEQLLQLKAEQAEADAQGSANVAGGRTPGATYAELAQTAALFPSAMEESELGEIPEGWEVTKTEQLAEKIAMGPFGSNIKVSTFVDSGVPIISGHHLKETLVTEGNHNFITEEHATKLKNSCVTRGDIVFTHAGNIGQVSLIPESTIYDKYVISQRQFYLRTNRKKASPYFLVFFFRSNYGQHILLSNASQVGVPSIARPSSHLKNIELIKPSFELMGKFELTCRSLLNGVVTYRTESQELGELRDTLLPKLLSGNLPISGMNEASA